MCSALGLLRIKTKGVVYNDITGSFLFILLDGSMCFFIMYRYKANAILAMPIAGLNDISFSTHIKTI
jgi:hypothetical protein